MGTSTSQFGDFVVFAQRLNNILVMAATWSFVTGSTMWLARMISSQSIKNGTKSSMTKGNGSSNTLNNPFGLFLIILLFNRIRLHYQTMYATWKRNFVYLTIINCHPPKNHYHHHHPMNQPNPIEFPNNVRQLVENFFVRKSIDTSTIL